MYGGGGASSFGRRQHDLRRRWRLLDLFDHLGLDGRALVEVFKAGRESVGDPASYAPSAPYGDTGQRRSWRAWIAVALVIILIVGLFLIGTNSDAAQASVALTGTLPGSSL